MIAKKLGWVAGAFITFLAWAWTMSGWTISGWKIAERMPVSLREPNAAMGPHDVVVAVMDSLQHNDSPLPNTGIRSVYQFASPANRRVTGPYGRFFRLVRMPPNNLLLKSSLVEYGALQQEGDRAMQDVTIRTARANTIKFRFVVSRQQQGPCIGCWMVDGVVPVR